MITAFFTMGIITFYMWSKYSENKNKILISNDENDIEMAEEKPIKGVFDEEKEYEQEQESLESDRDHIHTERKMIPKRAVRIVEEVEDKVNKVDLSII